MIKRPEYLVQRASQRAETPIPTVSFEFAVTAGSSIFVVAPEATFRVGDDASNAYTRLDVDDERVALALFREWMPSEFRVLTAVWRATLVSPMTRTVWFNVNVSARVPILAWCCEMAPAVRDTRKGDRDG